MTFFYTEIKKNPIKVRVLLAIILVLFIINGVMGNSCVKRQTADTTSDYKSGYDYIYSHIEGSINNKKIEWIISEKARLNSMISKGQFSTEFDLNSTYTGYMYSDNNLLNALYSDMKYAFEYASYAQNIVELADNAAKLCAEKGNSALAGKYTLISKQFSNRGIYHFYRTNGWIEYFSYEFSNLTVILSILIGLSMLFSQENETKTKELLYLTPTGSSRITLNKIKTSFSYTALIVLLFSIQDFLLFCNTYKLSGYINPLYSIPAFKNTYLSISIGFFVLLNFVIKLLGFLVFSTWMLLISSLSRSNMMALAGSFIILLLHISLLYFVPAFSFLPLLNSKFLCEDFSCIRIVNTWIPSLWFYVAVQNILISAAITGICVWNAPIQKRKRELSDVFFA